MGKKNLRLETFTGRNKLSFIGNSNELLLQSPAGQDGIKYSKEHLKSDVNNLHHHVDY